MHATKNQDTNFKLLKELKDKILQYHRTKEIKYSNYKRRSNYLFEIEKDQYEKEFYEFPFETSVTLEEIKIFHTFYEVDVWGSGIFENFGDEKLNMSLEEINKRVRIERAKYIYDKLWEKYCYIIENLPNSLKAYKQSLKFESNYPEEHVLTNLLNHYNYILSRKDIQLNVFEDIILNKETADIYTQILFELIKERLQILKPDLVHYQKEKKSKVISIDTIITGTIPLIKLKYNDQQNKQIIRLLYETLAEDYLDDTYKQFERHFINNRLKFRKSIWKGKEPEIAHLFKYLKDKRFMLSENQNKLIELHFLNKEGEEFKHRQLSVTLSKSNIEYYPKIHHLTEELKKLVLTFF